MFDREGFIDYVGAKSGNSYASGLARIENLYSVGIDAEYDKDKCEALLTQIEADKKRTDLDQKELKKRSDAASHLKRYITFKTNSIDTITDRIVYKREKKNHCKFSSKITSFEDWLDRKWYYSVNRANRSRLRPAIREC